MPQNVLIELLKEPIRPYYLKWLYFPAGGSRPNYFDACWQYPAIQPDTALPASGKTDIVFLPMSDWHTRLQRTQHIAREFARQGHRCYYLNPHLGREFPSVYPSSNREAVRQIEPGIVEFHVHLWREPVYHHRPLSEGEEERVAAVMARMLEASGVVRPILLTSFPVWNGVAERLRRRFFAKLVYDCHDLLEGFGNIAPQLVKLERELFEASDLTLFTSDWLRDRKLSEHHQLAGRWMLIRNAVDANHFVGVSPNASSTVTIGYVGSLNSWFDVDAVSRAAEEHPQWTFLLIGREESAHVAPLRHFNNVRFEGEVNYQDLPAWLSRMNAAIIPFRLTPLTLATNPLKLYEYLACGLPVVSGALPEIEQYAGLVEVYKTPEEFSRKLELAVEDSEALRQRRREAVRGETWKDRCQELAAVFDRLLAQ